MNVKKIIIPKTDFPNLAHIRAEIGFRKFNIEVLRLSPADIREFQPKTEVAIWGDVFLVKNYLERLGIHLPSIDYPEELKYAIGRPIQFSTLMELRILSVKNDVRGIYPPIFIKPYDHKIFNGRVISHPHHLVDLDQLPSQTPIWRCEEVDFKSEWRFYVHYIYDEGYIIEGVEHYQGDPRVFPDMQVVQNMIDNYSNAPCAYSLDVGIRIGTRVETTLVEVNDMIALGATSLNPASYAEMIIHRWEELTD